MKRMLWSLVTALLLIFPAMAFAADGYVTGNVNLRAGPDSEYPIIQVIPAGVPISIQGCTQGWDWCDVIVGPNRGWVAGTYIQYMYNNQPVYVVDYGAQIGIPIVTFTIASYWGLYYTNRPFYRERARWYSRPIPIRPPPRPPRPPVRLPGGRPPPGGNRPQPPRPQPPGSNRPQPPRPQPPGGNRPQPPGGGGNRPPPPGGGNNRPPPGNNNRPAANTRPAPRPNPQGNNGNNNGN
jgi:uncharacterized protein YraI